ncbi:hypothetical protein ATCC90586_011362 [Pythium insidiosum]|nr:hypothetical protein ATCC90586_011362 [Pythium insidiosum]
MLAWRLPRRQIIFGAIISRGAFGEVYRARYDDSDVAVKILAPDRRRLMHEIEDFAREALYLTYLHHERIVRFIGVAWNTPSDMCIVSELMTGGDVLDLLRQFQHDGQPQGFTAFKARIALHVAEALVYLHSRNPKLLHRDLKSKNILLTENGDAKLTDFGVSRQWEDLTLTAGVGSLLWMAPEVVFGERYDEKADIFSFGVW